MDLSNYEGALWYAGATLVAYYSADIGVCKGCISADGKVKKALHGLTALFFQRAFWAVVILTGRSARSPPSSPPPLLRFALSGLGVPDAPDLFVGFSAAAR